MDYHLCVFLPFDTTGIGSLPHINPEEACRLVLETFDIPFWPQLPQLSFREFMIPQFAEGMPFVKIDEQRDSVWLERNGSDALMKFYETYSDDLRLPVSEKFAEGLYTFLNLLKGKHLRLIKGQITGPLTFTLGLKDSQGKPAFFDEELREICLLVLKAKVRWQIDILKSFSDNVIIFIDEPILSAIGSSSYLGVNPDEVLRLLKDTSETIKQEGAIPGIHCCGKADWPLVINSEISIISFDAYDYVETISIYPPDFARFLENGGYLAWGIVPTTDAIKGEDVLSIKKRFDEGILMLSKSISPELLRSHILLTPSCGTGSLSIEETLKVFDILKKLKGFYR